MPLTLLCIATYRKGDEFLRECRRQGCRVLLLTEEKLRDADWPREAIDAFYYVRRDMPLDDIRKGAAHLARTERIDRIVALDDFDVELAAMLREYLFVPGMGETTARRFRDKLAMRRRARSAGLPCPAFVHTLNDAEITSWTSRGAAAVGAQAAVAGRGDRHPAARSRRRSCGARSRRSATPRRLPARAVRPRRRLPRRLDRLRPRSALRVREPLRDAADASSRTTPASS